MKPPAEFPSPFRRRRGGLSALPRAPHPAPPGGMESTMHAPLPVKGYTAQGADSVAKVNALKEAEERFLRLLRPMQGDGAYDQRFVMLAITHLQTATMFAGRAVFQPQPVTLPEDGQ